MKVKAIKFFSPADNAAPESKTKSKSKPAPTGHVSSSGKLVFPKSTLEEIGAEPETSRFMIGTDEGKRKLKSLYLIPTDHTDGSFAFEKSGRGHVISLALILQKGGIDYEKEKYEFTVNLFNYEEGVTAFELAFKVAEPKTRRRRSKSAPQEELELA